MITVKGIVDALQEKAPFETAEPWDNSGLLVGDREKVVSTVLVVLDITSDTVDQAVKAGAQLIISHHPVIFDSLKRLPTHHPAYRLAQENIAAVCVHTNLDKAMGGVNDHLAHMLELTDISVAGDGMCRLGKLSRPMTAEEFAHHVSHRLQTAVRLRAGTDIIRTVAVCGGAGGDLVLPLLDTADAALTGEVKHHEWLCVPAGKTLADGGHFATEHGVTAVLAAWLRETFPSLAIVIGEEDPPYQTVKD